MSVFINGFDKPKNCSNCPFNPSYLTCSITHGRIDRDDFSNEIECPICESKSDWILVSERLPKEFESVLVCYKSQGGMAQCVAERFVNMDGSNRWSAMYGQEPIAWMPLPKPYQESEG